jgi:hypothetical protein
MASGKYQHVAADIMHASNEAIGPGGDVGGRFAGEAAVAEEFPARASFDDVASIEALGRTVDVQVIAGMTRNRQE